MEICVALDSSKCTQGLGTHYTPTNLPSFLITIALTMHMFDTIPNPISFGATLTSLKVIGYSSGVSLTINNPANLLIADFKDIYVQVSDAKFEPSLNLSLSGSVIKSTNTSGVLNVKCVLLVSDGDSLKGKLNINVQRLILTAAAHNVESDITVNIGGLSVVSNSLIDFSFESRKVAFGNKFIKVFSGSEIKGVVLRSKFFIKVNINHNANDLVISRFGNPRPYNLFKSQVSLTGGKLIFSDQTWASSQFGNFIDVLREGSAQIEVFGKNIPANIENKASSTLEIIAKKQICGIQGTIKLNSQQGQVKNELGASVEFSANEIISASASFSLSVSGSSVSFSLQAKTSIAALFAGIKKLLKTLSTGILQLQEGILNLASDSTVSINLNLNGNVKHGSLDVSQELNLPAFGKSYIQVKMGNNSLTNFEPQTLRNLISSPINLLCAPHEFSCSGFKIMFKNEDIYQDTPPITQTCGWDGSKYCLRMGLTRLPTWVPEVLCMSKTGNCPQSVETGIFKAKNGNLSNIRNTVAAIHDKTKAIALFLKDDMVSTDPLNLDDIATTDASLNISTAGQASKVQVFLKYGNYISTKVNKVMIKDSVVSFDAVINGEITLQFQELVMRQCNLNANIKNNRFVFNGSNITLDEDTFKQFVEYKFTNLTIEPINKIDEIEITATHWIIKSASIPQFTIPIANVSGYLGAKFISRSKVDIKVASGVSTIRGFNFNIVGESLSSPVPVSFVGDWSSVTIIENGFLFNSDYDLQITGIPASAQIQLSGKGSVELGSSGSEIQIQNKLNVMANKYIKMSTNTNLKFQALRFDTPNSNSLSLVSSVSTNLTTTAESVEISRYRNIQLGNIDVSASIKIEIGSVLNASTVTFGNPPIGAKLLETTTDSTIEMQYIFAEGGFPQINASSIVSTTPEKIALIYNASETENELTDFSAWVDNPQTIIYGKGFDCDAWTQRVVFESACPTMDVSRMTLVAQCTDEEDINDEGYQSLQISLSSIPLPEKTPMPLPTENVESSNTGLIVGASVGVVAIGGAAGYFLFFRKPSNGEEIGV